MPLRESLLVELCGRGKLASESEGGLREGCRESLICILVSGPALVAAMELVEEQVGVHAAVPYDKAPADSTRSILVILT